MQKEEPSKIKLIIQGWANLIWENPEIEELAKKRLEICASCEKRSDHPEDVTWSSICTSCGCILTAKVRSKDSKCPIQKW